MATIHFILQGKGGVGKSMIAVMLYQALRHFGKDVHAYDTDPVNATLSSFREFQVTPLNILNDGNIDVRKFDALIEALVTAPKDSHVIVDNGASSFLTLGAYLQENGFVSLLEEQGHKVFLHSIVVGGQSLNDTLEGLSRLMDSFPQSAIVVWLNPFFGEIAMDGKEFDDFQIYQKNSSRFHALIRLPLVNRALDGKDLENLFVKRQSFTAGINSSALCFAEKTRLKHYWDKITTRIRDAQLFQEAEA